MAAESPQARTALVGISRATQNVCKEVGRLAAKPVTVLHDFHFVQVLGRAVVVQFELKTATAGKSRLALSSSALA